MNAVTMFEEINDRLTLSGKRPATYDLNGNDFFRAANVCNFN